MAKFGIVYYFSSKGETNISKKQEKSVILYFLGRKKVISCNVLCKMIIFAAYNRKT